MPNLWFIFTTGLLAGSLTCMAVQGGLLAATVAASEKGERGEKGNRGGRVGAILSFLIAKLVVYTLLGALLGWVGSLFQFSPAVQGALMITVAVFMIGTALALLDVHPIFRFFIIQPPKFLRRMVRQSSKSASIFGPALLGAFTIFIPCGTTQAMMALAVASQQPAVGAAILFAFVLGTSPLFLLVGYSMEWLKGRFGNRFGAVAATTIILLALWNANAGVVLLGSPVNLVSAARTVYCTVTFCDGAGVFASEHAPTNLVNITIQSRGYQADNPVIAAGRRVRLHLSNMSGGGCTQVFTIPKLGIQKVVPLGQQADVEFTAPKEPGELTYTCSMGMFGGRLFVVKG